MSDLEEHLTDDLNAALDVIESLVTQNFIQHEDNHWGHAFMSAHEEACDFLAEMRPDEWELTAVGIRNKTRADT